MSIYDKLTGNKNDEYKPTSYNDEEAVTAVGPNWRVEQEPAEQPATVTEAPRLTDVYWTPQRVLDEQQKRKDPNYVSPLQDVTTPEIDSVANYITSNREKDPTLWENGDPGWRADDAIWTSTVSQWKSPEETVPEVSAQSQTDAVQQGGVANVPTQNPAPNAEATDLQVTPKGRTLTAEKTSLDIADELIANDPRFKALDIDTSGANKDNLLLSEKLPYYALPATAGTDVKNQGVVEKVTQPLITTWMSSGGLANLAKIGVALLGGPPGWAKAVYTGVKTADFTYSLTKAYGLHEGNPIIDKFKEIIDLPDNIAQKFQSAIGYAVKKAGGGDLTDITKLGTNLLFIEDHIDDICHYLFGEGKASNEYNSDVWDIVSGLAANISADWLTGGGFVSRAELNITKGLDPSDQRYYLERNETTRTNSGLTGKFTIPEEMLGTNAIIYWLEFGQALYDAGVTDKNELEYILNNKMALVYGDRFNLSEMNEHEFTDPSNTAENMQARGMEIVGKVTGDKNLELAAQANKGNFLMDLAGQIPGLQGLIETVGRFSGNEVRSSSGIDEIYATWDMYNKTNPVDDLTARDRRVSGIDENGKIRGMVTPNENPNAVKNPFTKAKVALKNLFSPTNEYRARWEGDQIFEYINVGIDDAMRARPGESTKQTIQRMRQFINELENPSTISEDSPFAKISQSAMFRTIQDDLALAVKNNKEVINKAIEDYGRRAENRQILQALSKALKLDPARVLDMYENKKTVLTQMIINEADKNGGKIEGIDIPVEGADFGKQVIQRISPFTGKNADAWDTRQLTVLLSSKIADGVTDTIINKYNIQPEPFLYRFGDMVKKMQNLVLLGLSPSYLANNLINNVVTRSAIGYGGYMTGKQIKSFMDRFGFMPERLKESISGEIGQKSLNDQTNYDKLTEKIRGQRQRVEGSGFKKNLSDAMKKVGDAGSWASSTFGVFGNLSNKVESYESKQIVTSAMMTYLARTWKPGINFRKMPVALETAIREQNPGMVEAIYSAISSGINMTEIENAIYGTYVAPSVSECLLTSAERLGLDNADDIITEMFVKGGLQNELEIALKNKRGDEVAKVVDEIAKRLKQEMSVQYSEAVARKAVEVGLGVTNEGFVAACEAGQAAADEMLEVWLNGQFENDQLFERRINENMTPEEFHQIYSAQQQRLTERWKNVYAMQQQTFLGILRGLGINEPNAKTYVDKMVQKNQLWVDFYEVQQPRLFQQYLDACKWSVNDENKAQWAARVRKAWSQYRRESKKLVQDIQGKEMKLQEDMDKAYLTGLKQALGEKKAKEVDQTLKPIFEAIRNKRKEIIALNDEFRAKANKTNSTTKKNNIWGGENAEAREQVKKDYHDLQERLYQAIGTFNPFVTSKPAQEASVPEVDQEGNIRIDAAEVKAEEDEQVANDYSEMVSDQIDKTGEAESKATTPEGWKVELAKNNLRQVAENTGATHSLARAYATLVGEVLKNQWDSNHPGQDYFKENNIEVRYIPEDRFVGENRYSTIYFQTDQQGQPEYRIDTIDLDSLESNDNFYAWAGDNPKFLWAWDDSYENGIQSRTLPGLSEKAKENGEVIKWYHGSSSAFDSVDLGKAGRTGLSEGMGFYLTPHKEIAEKYHSVHKGKEGKVYEFVTNVSKPLDTSPGTKADANVVMAMADIIMKTLTPEELDELRDYNQIETMDSSLGTYAGYYNKFEYGSYPFYDTYSGDELINNALMNYLSGGWEGDNTHAINAYCAIMSGSYKYGRTNVAFGIDEVTPEIQKEIGDKRVDALRKLKEATGYDSTYSFSEGGKGHWAGDGDMILVVWLPEDIKAVTNEGEWSLDNSNFYHQESASERRIKGQFSVEGVKKLIELFNGSDFGTLTHESSHWFTLTLNDSQIEALAAYNGWTPERYRQLENQWYNAPDTMSAEDYKAWVDAQERFAYGFEQYLLEGKAPNTAMAMIFEKFKNFMKELYKGLEHLIYNGEEIDIHKSQNYVTLKAIYDSMLGESGDLEMQLNQLKAENTEFAGQHLNREGRINELKKVAQEKLYQDISQFVVESAGRLNLTDPSDAIELSVEILHDLGLSPKEMGYDIEENATAKHNIEIHMTKAERRMIRQFVEDHRQDAVKVSDDAVRKFENDIANLTGDEYFEQWRMLYGYSQTNENDQIAQAKADKEAQEAQAEADRQRTLKQEQIQFDFDKGKAVPLNAIDLSEIKPAGELNAEVDKLAQTFYDLAQSDDTATDVVKKLTVDQWKDYIRQRADSKGKPTITRTVAKQMDGAVQFWNKDNDYVGQVESLRTRRFLRGPVPQRGDFIVKTYVYENGAHQIVAQVIRNGKRVADVPSELPFKEVRNGSKVYKVLGVNPANPSLLVYQDGTEIRTAKMHTDTGTNAYAPEMEHRFTPATDPVAEAQNKEMYEKVLEILDDFKTTYAQAKTNLMMSNHYSDLSDDVKNQLRRYIDVDVRQDLANTKFKTTKFGEIMRDAALLNYSKRYGFDNFLTFICPYQFWMTRSFINWMNRMGSKGGRLWRRYARLKELERWNKKEYLPSKVSGKWGVYVPGLTEWMGNGAFMPTDQLGVVGNFFNPVLDFAKNTKKNVIASAEEILRQDRADGTITQEEYSQALDPLQREKSGIWQSALARAQMQEDSDPNFGGLMEQYLGFSLPVSIGRALLENNPQGWNQWPMSRAGNSWRAVAGDNIIGKGGQYLLSLPERTARDIASKKFGSAFEYKEFGEFGDYYIRNQVYDMVVEGRIDPVDAVQAVAEKDGNAIWEEAADRQREEVLMAMQGGHALSAIKDTAQDITKSNNGAEMDEHWLRDDLMNVFAGLLTAPLNKTVVREAESTWREQTGELNKAFASDDENAVDKFYDDNQNYEFKNLRYEADPEIALRQYLYKTITNLYYDMDKADQEIVKMSFGEDFENYVLNKETRAIESIDLSTLAGYAQALNGKVPFIATDKINTTKPQQFNMLEVSQAQKDAYNTYFEERERDWKGWADVNNIYWSLPANQREAFLQANPRLEEYQKWNNDQRENKDLDSFLGMRSDYYAMREAGKAVSMMSEPLLRAVTVAASTDAKLDKDYQTAIEILMRNVGTTKSYDSFVKNLKIYILGE